MQKRLKRGHLKVSALEHANSDKIQYVNPKKPAVESVAQSWDASVRARQLRIRDNRFQTLTFPYKLLAAANRVA
jgi:hypothetical protein